MSSVEQCVSFFQKVDVNNDGSLTVAELTAMLKKETSMSDDQIQNLFKDADTSNDGVITRKEFLIAMGFGTKEELAEAAMWRVFREFDVNGDGTIECSELSKVFAEMGRELSPAEVQRMIALVDQDGSKSVQYGELMNFLYGKKK